MTARLHAVEDSAAHGRVLLLGPSLGTHLGLFDAQVASLGDRLRIVRFDLRGRGGSEVVPGSCAMADLAADALALLDRLR